MNLKKSALALIACTLLTISNSQAEGWCTFQPGWSVVTHGTMSDSVFILGRLVGSSQDIWVYIATPSLGKSNVALALAAQVAGKDLTIYLDAPTATCANYESWSVPGTIRHMRM